MVWCLMNLINTEMLFKTRRSHALSSAGLRNVWGLQRQAGDLPAVLSGVIVLSPAMA
jgi:hypothetical protein